MKKAIVCTTINPPTEALLAFRAMKDWRLIVVGDMRTPHAAYEGWDYLSPDDQARQCQILSDLIGWNCIQRRNFGFIEAYRWGAEVIATVDDDNIPLAGWGTDLLIGREVMAVEWDSDCAVFDPLSATNHPELWHRGFPIPLLPFRNGRSLGPSLITPDIQADLWDGDPDIDAICRIALHPKVQFRNFAPFFSKKISPFNSQNTFISRRYLPDYFMYPGIGRHDDIWASYHVQQAGATVVYGPASVCQLRNDHNLVADLKAEMYGYEMTQDFISGKPVLPLLAGVSFDIYRRILVE
jgi:hypothetical protein